MALQRGRITIHATGGERGWASTTFRVSYTIDSSVDAGCLLPKSSTPDFPLDKAGLTGSSSWDEIFAAAEAQVRAKHSI